MKAIDGWYNGIDSIRTLLDLFVKDTERTLKKIEEEGLEINENIENA